MDIMGTTGSGSVINSEDLLCENFRNNLELYKVYEFRCPPYTDAATDNWIEIVRIPKYIVIYDYNCFGDIIQDWIIFNHYQKDFEDFIKDIKRRT